MRGQGPVDSPHKGPVKWQAFFMPWRHHAPLLLPWHRDGHWGRRAVTYPIILSLAAFWIVNTTTSYNSCVRLILLVYCIWRKVILSYLTVAMEAILKNVGKAASASVAEPWRMWVKRSHGVQPQRNKVQKNLVNMMTSSNGNIFRVTGYLCGGFTGPRWIPRTKASDAELWCFLWSASE